MASEAIRFFHAFQQMRRGDSSERDGRRANVLHWQVHGAGMTANILLPALDRRERTMAEVDDQFYDRADAHIHLSNSQLPASTRGKVSASMMYATARFNAWVSACGFASGEQMKAGREETLRYFCEQYRRMLEENLDDYIAHHAGDTRREGDAG